MTAMRGGAAGGGWRKLGVLILAVAAVGLPINSIPDYVALLVVAVIIFCSDVSAHPRAWAAAVAFVALAVLAQAHVAAANRGGPQRFLAKRRAGAGFTRRRLPADACGVRCTISAGAEV